MKLQWQVKNKNKNNKVVLRKKKRLNSNIFQGVSNQKNRKSTVCVNPFQEQNGLKKQTKNSNKLHLRTILAGL